MNKLRFVYFGGEPIGVPVLEALLRAGLVPSLVVCNPDRPAGRGHKLTPPPIKELAAQHAIPVYQPNKTKDPEDIPDITAHPWDLFVVVAYNRILPEWLIELPTHKTINVHPSLLPLRRGPNPIRSAIVEDDRASIGVSIMLMDREMDHGPLLTQVPATINDEDWPLSGPQLDAHLARQGGALLAATIPNWISGAMVPTPQDHTAATYTTKLTKEAGRLSLDPHQLPTGAAAWTALCTIRGLAGWPGTFFEYNNQRIKITAAEIHNDTLKIIRIIPAGKKEQPFSEWLLRQ